MNVDDILVLYDQTINWADPRQNKAAHLALCFGLIARNSCVGLGEDNGMTVNHYIESLKYHFRCLCQEQR